VLGAWPRIRRQQRVRDALLMSLGLIILANSRPYEGLVFSTPIALTMLLWLLNRSRPPLRQSLPRVVVPIIVCLLVASIATGYYYYRVTGSPFRTGYQVEADTYGAAPVLLWQTPHAESGYRHEVMRDFYGWELRVFETNRTFHGYLHNFWERLTFCWRFFLGPLLTIPLLALPWVIRQRRMWLPVLICAAMVVALSVETWNMPHYFAPATCALYLVLTQGMRIIWHWSPAGRPIGRAIVRAIPMLACAMILLRLTAVAVHVQIEPAWPRNDSGRTMIEGRLEHLSGRQLVIVVYGPKHNLDHEWVFNRADIDAARIVWARDMGEGANQELLRYFKDRRIWKVNADASPPQLEQYEVSE
jgi:hypothetical protein